MNKKSHPQIPKCPSHLVYVDSYEKGYRRIRQGKKFIYRVNGGALVTDKSEIRRIENLVIPPNWKEVWICKDKNGHIQSTGVDEAGRKQYIYHPDWIDFRQQNKYKSLGLFGESLDKIRRRITEDLKHEAFTREKTLALAVKLLDCKYLRIGSDFYLNKNNTYGLTTIRRKHVKEAQGKIRLQYKAKSGKLRNISITNRKLANLIKEVSELPGYEVFRYIENGRSHRIMSEDVNSYIKEISGYDFTAKDFRTWGGTVSAIDVYPEAKAYADVSANRKLETAIVRHVARRLGNTVATARSYYIHPAVLDALSSRDPESYITPEVEKLYKGRYLKKNEAIALHLIKNA